MRTQVKNILPILLVAIVTVSVMHWHASSKFSTFKQTAMTAIAEAEDRLSTLAYVIDNGGAADVAKVVTDCELEQRAKFDTLLSSLGTLSSQELLELDTLFGSCAFYFATVHSVGAASLQREVMGYEEYLNTAALVVRQAQKKQEMLPDWHLLAELEIERGRLQAELVQVQGAIVAQLGNGETVTGDTVQALVTQGQEIRQNILFIDQQVGVLHDTLSIGQ